MALNISNVVSSLALETFCLLHLRSIRTSGVFVLTLFSFQGTPVSTSDKLRLALSLPRSHPHRTFHVRLRCSRFSFALYSLLETLSLLTAYRSGQLIYINTTCSVCQYVFSVTLSLFPWYMTCAVGDLYILSQRYTLCQYVFRYRCRRESSVRPLTVCS